MCQMPNLTHFLGPGIDDGKGAECNKALKRNSITRQLIERLPKTSGFYQKVHRDVGDVVAFQQSDFKSSVEFTYEIAPAQQSSLWLDLRDKTRNVIRRASEKLEVTNRVDTKEFIDFYNSNLKEHNAINTYDYASSIKVCEEAIDRRRGCCLAIRSASGDLSAAIFYIWDDRSAYYFMSTRNHSSHNGAISLLIWNAILDASARGLIFDFDGLGTNGSNLFYIGFGGRVVPRFTIHRSGSLHNSIEILGRFVRALPSFKNYAKN